MHRDRFIEARTLFAFLGAERIFKYERLMVSRHSLQATARRLGVHPRTIKDRETGRIKSYVPNLIFDYATDLGAKATLVLEPDVSLDFVEGSCYLVFNNLNLLRLQLMREVKNTYRMPELAAYLGYTRTKLTHSSPTNLDFLVQYGEFVNKRVYVELSHEFLHTRHNK